MKAHFKLISILIFFFYFFSCSSQDLKTYLKDQAIKIPSPQTLNDSVYKALKNYNLLMVGKMPGTNESAQFVEGVAALLTSKGKSVQVGFEIPEAQMRKFINESSDSSIYASECFSGSPEERRENIALAKFISALNKNKNVKLFFFDTLKTEEEDSGLRDSLMYAKIKKHIKENPGRITITLSNNLHTMLQPFNGLNTAAYYLRNDNELKLKDKMCTLKHSFITSSINGNSEGAEKKQVKSRNLKKSPENSDNYLLLFNLTGKEYYNGVYYTPAIQITETEGGK